MLQDIQQVTSSVFYNRQYVDDYMEALESVLERKEEMIVAMQEKMAVFRNNLRKEQELTSHVSAATASQQ